MGRVLKISLIFIGAAIFAYFYLNPLEEEIYKDAPRPGEMEIISISSEDSRIIVDDIEISSDAISLDLANFFESNQEGALMIEERGIRVFPRDIYFFATILDACGATGNCNWILYSLNTESGRIARVTEEDLFFGTPGDYFIAPDGKRAVIISAVSAGTCFRDNAIYILDSGLRFEKVEGFEDDIYNATILESAEWTNPESFLFSTRQYYCDRFNLPSSEQYLRKFTYNASLRDMRMEKEERVFFEDCAEMGYPTTGNDSQECLKSEDGIFFEEKRDFCGQSTYGSCENDGDCIIDGCSGEVCRSKNDEQAITPCIWRECYALKESMNCLCVGGQCQWKSD